MDAPLASRRKPEEDGGSVAMVKANGCTLVLEDDNDNDELVLTDHIDRSSLAVPLEGSIFAVPAVTVQYNKMKCYLVVVLRGCFDEVK